MIDKKIVLCGKTCSGKTTFKNEFIKLNYRPSISYTTRSKRTNEIQDVDYHFINTEVFQDMIKYNKFLEYQIHSGSYYGTSVDSFKSCDIFILTPSAIISSPYRSNMYVIYLDAPLNTRIQRSIARGDSATEFRQRILEDDAIFDGFVHYDLRLELSMTSQLLDFMSLIKPKV